MDTSNESITLSSVTSVPDEERVVVDTEASGIPHPLSFSSSSSSSSRTNTDNNPSSSQPITISVPFIKNPISNTTYANETHHSSSNSPTSIRNRNIHPSHHYHHSNSSHSFLNPSSGAAASSATSSSLSTNPPFRTRHASFSAVSSSSSSVNDYSHQQQQYRNLGRSLSPSPSSNHITNRTYSPLKRHGSGNLSSRNPQNISALALPMDNISVRNNTDDVNNPKNNNNNGRVSGAGTPRDRGASLGADIGDIAIEAAVAVLEADAFHSQQRGRNQSHGNSYDFSSSSPNPGHPFLDALDAALDSALFSHLERSSSPSNGDYTGNNYPISPNAKYRFPRTLSGNNDSQRSEHDSIHTNDHANDHVSDSDDSDDENSKLSVVNTVDDTAINRTHLDTEIQSLLPLPSDGTDTNDYNDTVSLSYVSYTSENLQKANSLLLAYHEKTLQKLQFYEQNSSSAVSSSPIPLRLQPERIPRIPITSNHPNWANDSNCQHCGIKFTMLRRKHHCRGCGSVLCSACSPHNTTMSSISHNGSSNVLTTITPFAKGKFRLCRRCRALQGGRVLRSKTDPLDHLSWLDAIASGDTGEIETRLMYGQDVNAVCTEDDNYTALHVAAGITAFLVSQQRQQTVFTSSSLDTVNNSNISTVSSSSVKKNASSPMLGDTVANSYSNNTSGRQSPLLSFTGNPSTTGTDTNDGSVTAKNYNNNTTSNVSRSPFFSSFGSAISKLAGFSLSSSAPASITNINETNNSNGSTVSPSLTSFTVLSNETDTSSTLIRGSSYALDSSTSQSSLASGISPLSISTSTSAAVNVANIQSWWENRSEVERVSVNIIQLLLREGAYVNSQSASRRTPLHVAAMHGTARTVQILLEAGALQSAKDKNEFTPYDYAEIRALRGDAAGKYMVDNILDRTYSSRLTSHHSLLLQNSEDATVRRINLLTHIRTHLIIRAKLHQTAEENEKLASTNSSTETSPIDTLESSVASTASSNYGNDPSVLVSSTVSSHDSSLTVVTDPGNNNPDGRMIVSYPDAASISVNNDNRTLTDSTILSYSHNLDILSLVPNDEPVVGIASGESTAVLSEASVLSRAQSLPLPSQETLQNMNIQVLESAAQTLQANLMSVREGHERWLLEHEWMNRYAVASSLFLTNNYDMERIKLGPVPAIDMTVLKERNICDRGIYSAYFVSKINRLGLTPVSARFEPGWLRIQELTGKVWAQGHPTITYGDVTEFIETAFRNKQGTNYARPIGLGSEYDVEYDNMDGEEGGPDYDPDNNNNTYHPSHREMLDDERSQVSEVHDGDRDSRISVGPDDDNVIVHRSSIHRRRTISTLSTESSSSTTNTSDLDNSVNSSSTDESPSLNSSSVDHESSIHSKGTHNLSFTDKKSLSPSKENLDLSFVSVHSEGSGVLHVSLDAFVNGSVVPISNSNPELLISEILEAKVKDVSALDVPILRSSPSPPWIEPKADSESVTVGPPPPLRLTSNLSPLRLAPPSNPNRSVSAPELIPSDTMDDDYRAPIIREDGQLHISVNNESGGGSGLTRSLSRLRLNTDPEVAAHLRAKALQEEVDRESLASVSPRSMSMDGTLGHTTAFNSMNSFELSPAMTGNYTSQPFGINFSTNVSRTNSLPVSPFGLGRSTSVDTGVSPLINASSSSPGIRSILKRTGSFMSPSVNNTTGNVLMSPMTLSGVPNNGLPQSSPLLLPNNAHPSSTGNNSTIQISPSSSVISSGSDINSSVSVQGVTDSVSASQSVLLSPLLINPTSILPARSVRLSGTTSFELPPSASLGTNDSGAESKGSTVAVSSSFSQSSPSRPNLASGPFGSIGTNNSHGYFNPSVTSPESLNPPDTESTFYLGGNLTRSLSDNSVSSNKTTNLGYPFGQSGNQPPFHYTLTNSQSGLSVTDMLSRFTPTLDNLAPARSPSLSFASISSTGSGLRRNVSFRDRGGSVVSDVFTYAHSDRKSRPSASHDNDNETDSRSISSDEDNDSTGSVNGSGDDGDNHNGGSGGEDTDSESGRENSSALGKNTRIRSSSPTGFVSSGARTSRVQASEGVNAEGSQTTRSKGVPSVKIVSAIPSRIRTLLSEQNDGESTTEDEDMSTSETRATAALTSSSSFRNNSMSLRSPTLSFISPSELINQANKRSGTNSDILLQSTGTNGSSSSSMRLAPHSHRSSSVSNSVNTPISTVSSVPSSSSSSTIPNKGIMSEPFSSSVSLNLKLPSTTIPVPIVSPRSSSLSVNTIGTNRSDDTSSSSDEGYRTDSDDDIEEDGDNGTSDNIDYSTHSNASSSSTKNNKGTGAPKATGGPPVAQLTPKMMAIIASMAASRSNSNNSVSNVNSTTTGQAYYGQHQRSPSLQYNNNPVVPSTNIASMHSVLSTPVSSVSSTPSSTTNSTVSSIGDCNRDTKPSLSLSLGRNTSFGNGNE